MDSEKDNDESLLDPAKTPNSLDNARGIKRLNKVPLMVFGGVLVIVVFMFVYTVMSRTAQQRNAANQNTTQEAIDAKKKKSPQQEQVVKSVERMLVDAPVGTIPAAPIEAMPADNHEGKLPTVVNQSGDVYDPKQPATLVPVNAGNLNSPQSSLASAPSAERVKATQKVDQLAEQAVYSSTAISLADKKAVKVSGESVVTRTATSETDVMALSKEREALMSQRESILKDGANSDVVKRLASNLVGVAKNNGGSNSGFGDGSNSVSWQLKSERTAGARYAVKTGTIIPAIMIGGINSDLAGSVIAQVSQDVRDTATGQYVVIPQGARLFGAYNHDVVLGQERVMTRWDRIVFPDSSTIDLGGMGGADQMGYSGFKDQVNHHYWQIFGNAFLLSIISAGYQSALPKSQPTVNGQLSVTDNLSLSMAQQFNEVGSEMIKKNLQIKPTIQIRPGYRFTVMVNKDISFEGAYSPMELTER